MKIIFKNFCSPAIINIFFVIINTLLAISREDDKGALVQLVLGILLTLLLQVLCMKGMNILSWIIVFLPFIILILYYVFEIPIIYSKNIIDEDSHNNIYHEKLPHKWMNESSDNKHYHVNMPAKFVDSTNVEHVHKYLPDKWK